MQQEISSGDTAGEGKLHKLCHGARDEPGAVEGVPGYAGIYVVQMQARRNILSIKKLAP
jgi:hypothetical protein